MLRSCFRRALVSIKKLKNLKYHTSSKKRFSITCSKYKTEDEQIFKEE